MKTPALPLVLLLVGCYLFGTALRAQNIPDLLYYKFDGSGPTTPNLASSPPAGTANAALMGGVTQDTLGGLCSGSLIGTGNSSNSDYVNTNWAPLVGSPWTISFRTSNITPSSLLFYMFGDINAGEFRCFTNGVAGPGNWILRGQFADVVAYGGAVTAPTMTTFVYDFATNDIRAYVNGVLVNTVPQSGISFAGIGPFKVGGYATNIGLPAGGALDEFRMYSRALSAAEVAQLYNPFATSGFLGADQNICPGTPVSISQPWPVSHALWSTGSTNPTLSTDTAGTYILTLSGACGSGADTITLNSLASTATLSATVCDRYTAPSGHVHTVSGLFTDTIPNAIGCDSLIRINLTVKNSTSAMVTVSACESYTAPGGSVWTTSGVYADTIPNAAGCDSLITVNLTIKHNTSAAVTVSACESYTSPSGSVWTTSGVYADTIPNAAGCDSLITVDLTIKHNTSAALTASACGSYTSPGGSVWTTSGVYADTIPNAAGCDSLITVNLTIKNNTSAAITASACNRYISPGGRVWQTSGTYRDTLSNAAGCDSVITVILSIQTLTASAGLQGTTLTASPAGATYRWINCATDQPVAGATGVSFTPSATGNYAVVVVSGICTDTSDCRAVTVSGAGLADYALAESVFLYPNPTTGGFVIQTDVPYASLTVEVVNMLGQNVLSKRVQNSAQVSLQLDALPGLYYVILTLDSGQRISKPLLKN